MTAFEIAAAVAAWHAAGLVITLVMLTVPDLVGRRDITVYPRDLILAVSISPMGPIVPVMLFLFGVGEWVANRVIGPGDSGVSIRIWPRAAKGAGR